MASAAVRPRATVPADDLVPVTERGAIQYQAAGADVGDESRSATIAAIGSVAAPGVHVGQLADDDRQVCGTEDRSGNRGAVLVDAGCADVSSVGE